MSRIHVTGASGSGTTTLGVALAHRLGVPHFDADDYFWLPTDPHYSDKRDPDERNRMLLADLQQHESWVLSGAHSGWGTGTESSFDLVVFLYVPQDLRLSRLHRREQAELGASAIEPGGALHERYREFIEWARRYDSAGLEQRSLRHHEAWLATLSCPVLRIEGDTTTDYRVQQVLAAL